MTIKYRNNGICTDEGAILFFTPAALCGCLHARQRMIAVVKFSAERLPMFRLQYSECSRLIRGERPTRLAREAGPTFRFC
jgi:hypothetical protein